MSFRVESDFKQRTDALMSIHVRNLIAITTGFEESDENFGIAEEYIISNLRQHRFLEVDKFKVKREINGLQEKFAIHSQERKGQRLGELIDKFMNRKLKPHTVDVHYSIIQFLLLMSNNPISDSNVFDEIQIEEQPPAQPKQQQQHQQSKNNLFDHPKNNQMTQEEGRRQFASSGSSSDENDDDSIEEEEDDEVNDDQLSESIFWKKDRMKLQAMDKSRISNSNSNYGTMSMMSEKQRLSQLKEMPSTIMPQSAVVVAHPSKTTVKRAINNSMSASGIFTTLPVNQSIWESSQSFGQVRKQQQHHQLQLSQKETSLQRRTYEEFLSEQKNDDERAMFLSARSFSRADLFRDPNCLASIYESHMKESQISSQSQQVTLNRWIYETKTERQIVQDIILMLLGESSPSFILVVNLNEPSVFKLTRKIQLSHLTPSALENLLDQAIEFANALLKFQFARNRYADIKNIGTSFQAFLASIKAFQINFQKYLNSFHLLFLHQSAQITRKEIEESIDEKELLSKEKVVSLMELMNGLRGFQVEITMMMNMLEGVVEMYSENVKAEKPSEIEANTTTDTHIKAFLATRMIDFLYFQVQEDKTIATSSSMTLRTINAQMFMQCIEPYLGILNDWLHGGFFYDRFSEFFIQNNRRNQNKQQADSRYQHIDHKIDWNHDFSIRNYQDKDTKISSSVTPTFLKKEEQRILEIGKNVRLIGYVLSEQNQRHPTDDKLKLCDIRKDVLDCVNSAYAKIEEARKRVFLQAPFAFGFNKNQENLQTQQSSVTSPPSTINPSKATPKKLKMLSISQILDAKMKAASKENIESLPQTPQTRASDLSNPFNIFSASTPQILNHPIFSLQTSFAEESYRKSTNALHSPQETQPKSLPNPNQHLESRFGMPSQEWKCESGDFVWLFEQSMGEVLRELDIRVKKYLGTLLMHTFRLADHFSALRQIYFMENGSLSSDFSTYLFDNLETAETLRNVPSIRTYFQELLAGSSNKILQSLSDQFVVEIKYDPISTYLKNIKIQFTPQYPLDAIFDTECGFLYNHIFQFVLQLKKAQYFLTDKNYFLKRQTKVERYRRYRAAINTTTTPTNSSKNQQSSMEIEADLTEKTRICSISNAMKKKLSTVQRELLNFTYAFSFFAFVTIISAKTTEFLETISKEFDIAAFIALHKSYLKSIADYCFLSKKSAHIFAIISNLLKLCSDFHSLVVRLEALETLDTRTFSTETIRINKELQAIKASSKQHVTFLVTYINAHDDQLLKTSWLPLCQQLDFNNFYIPQDDQTTASMQPY